MILLCNSKKPPRKGELLVTEANCAIREDSSIFMRSALTTVKDGKILEEIINLGRGSILMPKGENLTRVFPVELVHEEDRILKNKKQQMPLVKQ